MSRRERAGIKRCERCSPPPSNTNYRRLEEKRTVTVIYPQQNRRETDGRTDGHTTTETTLEKQTTAVATSGCFCAVDQTERTLDLNALTVPYPGLESERERGSCPESVRKRQRDQREKKEEINQERKKSICNRVVSTHKFSLNRAFCCLLFLPWIPSTPSSCVL